MIHTIDCDELDKAQSGMADWLDVAWGKHAAELGTSVARVLVRVKNAPGSLGAVMTVIGNNGGNIFNMKVTSRNPLLFRVHRRYRSARCRAFAEHPGCATRECRGRIGRSRARAAGDRRTGAGRKNVTPEQVLNEFKKAGALLEGHFILSSGLHSDVFLQKALVFQDAKRTAKLCKALAEKVRARGEGKEFTAIVSPAVGGIVPGYEMGRQLGLPAMYVERQDGKFQLRRSFHLEKNQPVLMVEDIVTTGLSSARMPGGDPRRRRQAGGRRCLIDRSGGKAKLGVKFVSLAAFKFPAWEADKLPQHLKGTQAVKPGSRGLV